MSVLITRIRSAITIGLFFSLSTAFASGLGNKTIDRLSKVIESNKESEEIKSLAQMALDANNRGNFFEVKNMPHQDKKIETFYDFSRKAVQLMTQYKEGHPHKSQKKLLKKATELTDDYYSFEADFITELLLNEEDKGTHSSIRRSENLSEPSSPEESTPSDLPSG